MFKISEISATMSSLITVYTKFQSWSNLFYMTHKKKGKESKTNARPTKDEILKHLNEWERRAVTTMQHRQWHYHANWE